MWWPGTRRATSSLCPESQLLARCRVCGGLDTLSCPLGVPPCNNEGSLLIVPTPPSPANLPPPPTPNGETTCPCSISTRESGEQTAPEVAATGLPRGHLCARPTLGWRLLAWWAQADPCCCLHPKSQSAGGP